MNVLPLQKTMNIVFFLFYFVFRIFFYSIISSKTEIKCSYSYQILDLIYLVNVHILTIPYSYTLTLDADPVSKFVY